MPVDAVRPHRVEQRDRADDVVAPVQRRLPHRLPHERACAAKWITASIAQSPSTGSSAATDSWWNSAARGTASAWPVDRSSTTTTSWPSASSRAATTLPM